MMLDIADVVRKQIALYRAHDMRAERAQQLSFGPYLLISREKGAGGSVVGQLAGQRMSWQVFDAELVNAIAQQANVRRELIESLDERAREMIEEIVRGFLAPQPIDTPGYLASLREVVLTLGHQGNVVIVGRGAQYILPTQFGLRVRLVAPTEVRIRRIASARQMSLKAAQMEVESSDRERARVVRRHYGREVHDPFNYDLIINTTELTVEAAAEITVAALHHKLTVHSKERR